MTIQEMFEKAKPSTCQVSDAMWMGIEDARRFYKPGEISEKTGLQIQPDGSWAEPHKNSNQPKTRTLSAEMKIRIRPSSTSPVETATSEQVRSLEKISHKVNVSKIDSKSIEIVDKTVKALMSEFGMKPLDFITTYNKVGGAMGESDGDGLFLNEDFFNDPGKYYKGMIDAQDMAKKKLSEADKLTPIEGMEEDFAEAYHELKKLTVRLNVLYEGQEVECVTLHEMAHVLSNQRVKMLHGEQTEEMKAINSYVEKVYNKAMGNDDILLISRYAMKEPAEFFAEAFVVYKLGKEKLPDYITDMVERVIK